MVLHPAAVLVPLTSTPGSPYESALKAEYWIHLLLPVALLPLLSPLTMLVAMPIVAEHLLSFRTEQHTIVNQYTALVTPFVIASTVLGLARLARFLSPE